MTEHKMRAHSVLSPSGAERWLHCTPSALLEQEFPDTTSDSAKEGTLAHELAEAKLQHYVNTEEYSKRKLTTTTNKLKKDPLWNDEMQGYTDSYMDVIKAYALSYSSAPYVAIEQRLDLKEYIPPVDEYDDPHGFADCIMIGDQTIQVIDFKYGKGVPVYSEENPQMMLYALGAYSRYKTLVGEITKVKLSIIQPRIDNNSDWECSLEELLSFGEKVYLSASIAAKGEGEYIPGDWCRFCRANAKCRARADQNVYLAFMVDKKPPLLTNDEVGTYLAQGEDVAKWLKGLQEYALTECLAGRDIAGYKAVEGRGSRDWTDMDKAFAVLEEAGTDEAMLWERKPLSLAQVEKLIGKKDFAATVGDLVIKNPGKPTLVPEGDKREAITNVMSAAEAFK